MGDLLAVPHVLIVGGRGHGLDQMGGEQGETQSALVAHGAVGQAVFVGVAQGPAQSPGGAVIVRIVPAAIVPVGGVDVTQPGAEAYPQPAHHDAVVLQAGYIAEIAFLVIAGFGDGGGHALGAVEHAVVAVGEARALGAQVHEGAERVVAAGNAPGAASFRHPVQFAHLHLQARIGERLDRVEGVEIALVGDVVENMDRRVLAVDQPVGVLVPAIAHGQGRPLAHHWPPRRLSSWRCTS